MIWKCIICKKKYFLRIKRDKCIQKHWKEMSLAFYLLGRMPPQNEYFGDISKEYYKGNKKWQNVEITFKVQDEEEECGK